MSASYYRVALALDRDYIRDLDDELKAVFAVKEPDLIRSAVTPDNVYTCFYWDVIPWDAPEVAPLLRKLESVRHALVTVDEDGEVWKDTADCDAWGCDEEFNELLTPDTGIIFRCDDSPLAPQEDFVPISKKRLITLLQSYVFNDYDGMCETFLLREALSDAGFSEEEIRSLGFGFCLSEEE